jgi:asparagine synthase (glutamine-hydrolysing)
MCGIAGLVDYHKTPEESVLRAMERLLLHRGPDEGGIWLCPQAGLAHRRLRIIDLSPRGAQPMSSEDGRVQVVFNGEIYNHHALRAELMRLGHEFRSRADTEVLVHGYESWGADLVRRLRGMFAFALWDNREQRTLLARDRVGKKPLFYSQTGTRFAFGSELSVFKAVPGWPLRLGPGAFHEYLEYGYVQSPCTILEGVWRLPAGHYALLDRAGLKIEPYWSPPDVAAEQDGVTEAALALEEALRDAVACRLESDVPLGCFLSGGVDSSLVAALAQESLGRPLKTYTVGFEESAWNEAGHARQVAARLGTDHHELPVNPKAMVTEFEEILTHLSEPLGDDSFVPTFLISRETRRFVTVALSGDGGDELFGGYSKYRQFQAAQPWRRLPAPWRLLARLSPNDTLHKRCAAMGAGGERGLARWLSSLFKREDLVRLLREPAVARAGVDLFDRSWERWQRRPSIERWMLTDMETYLEGDILVKLDRASMAVALEGRSPFLDGPFIEQALRWPCRAQLPEGGKTILKTMLAKRLPAEWFARPKQGFGMPIEAWFREELREVLLRYTDPARLRRRGLLAPEVMGEFVAAHLSGRRNFARKLYAVVAFEVWADGFFGPDTALG